jgi:hypothetical protein
MNNTALVTTLLLVLTGCTNNIQKANNLNKEFNLQFKQHSCPETIPAPTHSSFSNNENLFSATITTSLTCGLVAQDPEIFVNSKGITLAVNAVSPSGFTAACLCSRTLDFSFTIPTEFEEYRFELISFTINKAVVDIIPVEKQK